MLRYVVGRYPGGRRAAMATRLRRAGVLAVVGVVAMVPTVAARAASQGWSQSGGGPGNTAAVTAPGNLSPATVTDLALDYSVPVGDFVTQSPALVGGVLYAGTLSGRIVAIDAGTGRAQWSRSLCDAKRPAYNGSEETSPAVGSGAVFVLGDGGVMTGIHLAAPHDVFACVPIPGEASGNGWSPTLVDGVVYAATASHVVAVNARSGAVIWSHILPAGYSTASNVVVDAGVAFVAANSGTTSVGHVLAFGAADGHPRWAVTRHAFVETLAATDGRVITGGGTVQAWAETTGWAVWTSSVHGADAVTISGNRVVVAGEEATTSSGALLALDATTGDRVWRTGIGSEEESQPSAGGGVTYLTDLDTGSVFINRLSDGHLLAVISHPGGYYDQLGTPVVVGGHIYLFTQNGSSSQLDRWSTAF
jgi:outer membrane protein assembly factor BamB